MKNVSWHITKIDRAVDDVKEGTLSVDQNAEGLLNLTLNIGKLVYSAAV